MGQPAVSQGGRGGPAPVFGRAHGRGLSLDRGRLGASGRQPDGGSLRACPLGASQYLALLPVVTASVALATVAGFAVAVLPGGLGVREGVLMYALTPALGDQNLACVAALALRLVWVAAELLAAAVLLPLGARDRPGPDVAAEPGEPPP